MAKGSLSVCISLDNCTVSSGLPPWEAPVMIAEKSKLFFFFLIAQWAQCTSHGLLDGNFHVGGPDHHVAGSIQDDALPGPLVQEQHLALTRHHILASH